MSRTCMETRKSHSSQRHFGILTSGYRLTCLLPQDNYNRMLQEQKPKKIVRKKSKAVPITRTPKRNKRKKKENDEKAVPSPPLPPPLAPPIVVMPPKQSKQKQSPKFPPPIDTNLSWNHSILSHADTMQMILRSPDTMSPSINHYLSDDANMYQFATNVPTLTSKLQHPEMFTVCENSSAYESSEDTGVGGLSENELMGVPDGIGSFVYIVGSFDCY